MRTLVMNDVNAYDPTSGSMRALTANEIATVSGGAAPVVVVVVCAGAFVAGLAVAALLVWGAYELMN